LSSSWPGVFGLTKSNEGQALFSVFAQFHPKGWRTAGINIFPNKCRYYKI
jgi:hypothetical protein